MFFPMKQEENPGTPGGRGRGGAADGQAAGPAFFLDGRPGASRSVVQKGRFGILRYGKIWDVSFI